jgi:hypothetical protein
LGSACKFGQFGQPTINNSTLPVLRKNPHRITMLRMYNAGEIALMGMTSSKTITGGGVVAGTLLGSAVYNGLITAEQHFSTNGDFGSSQKPLSAALSMTARSTYCVRPEGLSRFRLAAPKETEIEEGLTGDYSSCARSFKPGFDAFVHTPLTTPAV